MDKRIFDSAQRQVERLIEETTYPNFLHSDIYLRHVQKCQSSGPNHDEDEEDSKKRIIHSPNERPTSPHELELDLGCSKGNLLLPTLHEDSEFVGGGHGHPSSLHQGHHNQQSSDFSKGERRLTKDVLMATQHQRAQDVRPKPEAFAGYVTLP